MINQTFFVQLQFSVVHDVVVRTFANATPNLEFWRENCSNTNDENSDSLHFFQKNPGNGFPNTYSTDTKKNLSNCSGIRKARISQISRIFKELKKILSNCNGMHLQRAGKTGNIFRQMK